MNYSTDKAITCYSEDLLGRASFSKQLGKAISEYQSNDSLVIGLFGKWGTGKTSVINMVLESISSSPSSESTVPIVLKFAPWNYSDKSNLISIFFSELSSRIVSDKSIASRKKIGEILQNYSGTFQATAIIPICGIFIAPILTNVAKATGAYLSKAKDLDKLKLDLSEELIKAKRKIVVVIDDIDRLTNEQIRDIFQLVKQVGDLPNIIYLLSMDREVVTNALSEIHKCDGNEYLEKIIQVPFEIPELSKDKIGKIFLDRFHQVVANAMSNPIIDQHYLNLVFTYCIAPYINTIRDVNRVINIFQFKLGLLHKELSVEDMIAITTIEVLNPTLYIWIISNKFTLCGKAIKIDELDHNIHKDTQEYYDKVFRELGLDTVKTEYCLAILFPAFAEMIGLHFYDASEVRGKMRIAFNNRFDYCFSLDEDYISVPRKTITDFVFHYSKPALIRTVNDKDILDNFKYFIDELESLIDSIPYSRVELIASVLLNVCKSPEEINHADQYLFSAYALSKNLANMLIRKLLTSKERLNVYYSAFSDCTVLSFLSLVDELYILERAYGRTAEAKTVPNDQILDLEHLFKLESLFVRNATKLFQPYKIVEIRDFEFILDLWRKLDPESSDNYINSILSDDVLTIKLICLFASNWNSTKGSGWQFNSTNYSGYFTNESIKTRIEKIDKKEINKFTHDEQLKLASFIMNFGKSRDKHVTLDEAQALLDKWKGFNRKTDDH